MNSKILAISLMLVTTALIVLHPLKESIGTVSTPTHNPIQQNLNSKIEVVFVLDTTGSMGGLLQAAKEKIWSIASTMASAKPAPQIKMGLVAYRDRGDDYVTKVIDLSLDLDSVYAELMDFQAAGGGDGPESVNKALYDAVHGISWSQAQNSYQTIFLVGDAPPHMDYQNELQYPEIIRQAKAKGITVNAIQCGNQVDTRTLWLDIAQNAGGHFFQVNQAGSAIAMETPYGARIALLSTKLDETKLYYGSKEEKAMQQRKRLAIEKLHKESSVSALARRGAYNSSTSGKENFLGEKELVEEVISGRTDLKSIKPGALPESMQSLNSEQQKQLIKKQAKERKKLQQEIKQLSKQRKEYLAKNLAKSEMVKDSIDQKIFTAIREQAKEKGLHYEEDDIDY